MTEKTTKTGCLAAVVSVLALSVSGCGGPGDQPELGHVTGTITYKGLPLSGIEVVFYPENGRPARGRTDAEGKYELRYIRETMGAKVGPNRVEIAPSEEAEDAVELEGDVDSTVDATSLQSGRPVIPARYNTKSELEVIVKPGENTFDFAIET